MDGSRFDALTRTLARGTSRRGLLRGALGGLAGALAAGRLDSASAACPPDQIERRGLGCVCRMNGRPPNGAGCPCPSGQVRCGETCVDLDRDEANCGRCGDVCPAGLHCL